jgi:hypothetical protein
MKRIWLLTLVSVITVSASAQVQFGIKGGVNVTDIKDDLAPGATDSRVAFHVGALAHIHLSKMFAIQPEASFSSEGAEYRLAGFDGITKTNYINVPVLLQFQTSGFRLQTGPQLGILVSSEFEADNSTAQNEIDITNNVNFSWSFGAGFLTKSGLGIDARYNLGLSNMYESGTAEAKSRVWQFGLFYQFGK